MRLPCATLTELDLASNVMRARGAMALAPVIERPRTLFFYRNKLGPAGAACLAPAIKALPRVEFLVLGRAQLWEDAGLPGLQPRFEDANEDEDMDSVSG